MKKKLLILFFILVTISLLGLTSCFSNSPKSDFYNAGNENLSITGSQFDQYSLFRFDTSTSSHTLALPSAADIVANMSSPYVGEVIYLAVTADGSNAVTLISGANVIIKSSALSVAGNTTVTMYCEFDNVTAGSEAVTIY